MKAEDLLTRNIQDYAPIPFKDAVALGKVPFWRTFRKFGMNDTVPATGTEEIWPVGTTKVWPTAAAVLSTVSSSAADSAAGIGTRSIIIEGLDANYDEITETVALNGTSAVTTTQSFFRVNRAYGATAGSNEINVGDITISLSGDPQAYIEANEGQTHQTHYTVPAGHVMLIDSFHVGVGRMSGSSDLHVQTETRDASSANSHWVTLSDVYLYQNTHDDEYSSQVVNEKCDIRQVVDSSSTTQAFSIYSGYLVKQ